MDDEHALIRQARALADQSDAHDSPGTAHYHKRYIHQLADALEAALAREAAVREAADRLRRMVPFEELGSSEYREAVDMLVLSPSAAEPEPGDVSFTSGASAPTGSAPGSETPPAAEASRVMSGPATLADLRRTVQATARKIGREFRRPDDDWSSALIVQTPDDVVPVPLAAGLMEFGYQKDIVAGLIKRAVAEVGALRYALLLNTHMVREPDQETLDRIHAEQVRIGQLPGAVETLVLVVGDAESEELWLAQIERDGIHPPWLKPWYQPDHDKTSGRFAGLNQYLRQPRR